MKALNRVREFLESRVLERVPGETYNDFFLRVLEKIPLTKTLSSIVTPKGDSLYIYPLDTLIKYEYENDIFLGVYVTHSYLQDDSDIYPLGLNEVSEEDIIGYIKEKLVGYEYILEEVKEHFPDGNICLKGMIEIIKGETEWCEHQGVKIVNERVKLDGMDREEVITLYFQELNTIVTLDGGYYDSWNGTNWENARCYLSRPITQLSTIYEQDERHSLM